MPTVKLPIIGEIERTQVLVVGAVAAGVLGYAWWKRGRSSTAPTATADVPGLDPATGSAAGDGSYDNPNPGASGYDTSNTSTTPDTPQEWTDLAVTKLTDFGYEPGFVARTLGRYLDRQPLTADEIDIVRQAWAVAGYPPGGPTTYTTSTSASTPSTPTRRPVPGRTTPPAEHTPIPGRTS